MGKFCLNLLCMLGVCIGYLLMVRAESMMREKV